MRITSIAIFSITLLASIVNSQKVCNGYAELCDRSYSDIAYVTTHNSYASGKVAAANQNFNITIQLKDEVRGFMLDSVFPENNTKEVHLCHNTCNLLDAGPAVDTLTEIVEWLDENPNEVITILWENVAQVPASAFDDFYTKSGMDKISHVQTTDQPWPTLGSMIDSGKRVVSFINPSFDQSPPWLMAEFGYVFETPFENTNPNAWQCTIDRPKGEARPLYVLNHFLYNSLLPPFSSDGKQIQLPQPDLANVTNAASLAGHAQQCQQTFNKIPNFVAVDFYDKGGSDGQNVFSVVADLNRVKYVRKPLGDGTTPDSQPDNKNGGSNVKGTAARPSGDLRSVDALIGLAGVCALVTFLL